MLRRQVGAIGSLLALAALMVAGLGPAVADDDAGWGDGGMWGSADEQQDTGSGDTDGGGGTDGDGSSDTDSATTFGGSGGGGECSDDESITLALAGFGNCALAPGLDVGDPAAAPPPAPVVDARDQAEQAYDRLPLETANVRLAPGPPLPTYPNLETWVWVPESQWRTLTLSVPAGATTVHVEARPVRLDIDSGERDQLKYSSRSIDPTFSCSGPGRAWDESLGDDAETSCSYTYMTTSSNNPAGGDRYRLTASIVYEGSWTCVGQCTEEGGSLGEVSAPSGTQTVDVQERQSVVVSG